ncbi:MAG TPA: STAS domain-containing protein [Lentisphaeria bacterium]|nr:STAS domain-containing protein [Lentisphaeria bacterium]
MALSVAITKRPAGGHVVAPTGRLDTVTHQEFEQHVTPLMNGGTHAVVLDMAGVEYISSAGLRVIFKLWKNLASHKGVFTMINLQPQIKAVFDIVKALPKETVFASIEEADRYLTAMQEKALEKLRGGAAS